MPVYEYRCADCDQFFDRLVPYDSADPPCPACEGGDVRRLISLIHPDNLDSQRVAGRLGCDRGERVVLESGVPCDVWVHPQ